MSQKQTKEFYASKVAEALGNLQSAGFKPLFLPALADLRIAGKLWGNWYTAPSIRATGKTKQGNKVVLYAHRNNHFSNPDHIREAITQGLINGAGILPNRELQRLLKLEDNKTVFVLDYAKLRNSPSGVIFVEEALEHPQTIPFLGGKERAQKYLEKYQEIYGDKIGVWHSDDLRDTPLARILFLGYGYGGGLNGGSNLCNNARFVGVSRRVRCAEGASQKFSAPTLEEVLGISRDLIPDFAREEFKRRLGKLYK